VPMHPLFKSAQELGLGSLRYRIDWGNDLLGLQKGKKELRSEPASRKHPSRVQKLTTLGKVVAEVLKRDGGQRRQGTTGRLSPRDELRGALETVAYRPRSVPTLLEPVRECIKMRSSRS